MEGRADAFRWGAQQKEAAAAGRPVPGGPVWSGLSGDVPHFLIREEGTGSGGSAFGPLCFALMFRHMSAVAKELRG